jgi:peptide deformylase
MILPVLAFGHPTLRKVGQEIDPGHPGLEQLIADMFETMYQSDGVGLAAPQVNQSIRLFIIDAAPYADKYPEAEGFKKVFINAKIEQEEGEEWAFNEGCLCVPGIREDVQRKPIVYIRYQDENFQPHNDRFEGMVARIIQHEYDHTEGILFVDKLSPLRKMLLKGKLNDISRGNIDIFYKMIFPLQKKGRK